MHGRLWMYASGTVVVEPGKCKIGLEKAKTMLTLDFACMSNSLGFFFFGNYMSRIGMGHRFHIGIS